MRSQTIFLKLLEDVDNYVSVLSVGLFIGIPSISYSQDISTDAYISNADTLEVIYNPARAEYQALLHPARLPADTLVFTSGAKLLLRHRFSKTRVQYIIEPPRWLSDSTYFVRRYDTLRAANMVAYLRDYPGIATLGGCPPGGINVAKLKALRGLRVRIAGFDCSGTYPVVSARIRHLRDGRLLGTYSPLDYRFEPPPQRADIVLVDRIIYNTPIGRRSHAGLRYTVR